MNRRSGGITPIEALLYGVAAGIAGSFAQNYFFKMTSSLTPKSPEGAFDPPEEEQKNEMGPQTVARRFVEHLMQRGPLSDESKKTAGNLVHFAFGGAWGGLYGLIRESFPDAAEIPLSLGFSSAVWTLSDNVILPAFKLSAWPHRYPLKSHAYALAAHWAYGAGVSTTFAALTFGRNQIAKRLEKIEVPEERGQWVQARISATDEASIVP